MKSFFAAALVLLFMLGASNQSHAALTLNNIQHFSDAGGVWNNTGPRWSPSASSSRALVGRSGSPSVRKAPKAPSPRSARLSNMAS